MDSKGTMEAWYKYRYETVCEQSDDQMRLIFAINKHADKVGDKVLKSMINDYYMMRMEKDM
jgi:hypothetical protein